jgi:nitrogen regulatory protein PII
MAFTSVLTNETTDACPKPSDNASVRSGIKKIEAIVSAATFEAIRPALELLPVEIAVTQLHILGSRDDKKLYYRGEEYTALSPKVKLEIIVPAQQVADVADAFGSAGRIEAYKIFLYDMGPATPIPVRY